MRPGDLPRRRDHGQQVCAAGVPSVLVPLVVSTTGHQRDNAEWMAQAGAAWHLPQKELNADGLASLLAGLDRDQLLDKAERARALARSGAAGRWPTCASSWPGNDRASYERPSRDTDMKHRVKHIHFVGIGGVGMCGIAEVLHGLGFTVSGSDMAESATSKRLIDQGIRVFYGHDATYMHGADVVVTSTAVKADNPEVLEARANKIPVIPRAMMLAELMRFKQGHRHRRHPRQDHHHQPDRLGAGRGRPGSHLRHRRQADRGRHQCAPGLWRVPGGRGR